MRTFLVYFKYKPAEAKKPGPVRHYRIYADTLDQARQLVKEQGNYPDIEIIEIKPER